MPSSTLNAVSRVAPSGVPVELTVPDALGTHRWYASTRFSGPRTARQFFFAPAGEHRVIPTHALPGATERRRSLRGHDAVLYEARDRSDSALVLAGPYHETTTWFGGPAPDDAGLAALLGGFRFTDSAHGASLVPTSSLLMRQSDTSVIGRGDRSVLIVRPAADALPGLPTWAGLPVAGGELWRAGRGLGPEQSARVAGTAHEWRWRLAGPSAASDVVFLGPESGRAATDLSDAQVLDALGALAVRWGA